jgi:hypothetical protein
MAEPGPSLHARLQALLNQGQEIYSFASGRVGPVLEVDMSVGQGMVVIQTRRGRGLTTFLAGDEVALEKRGPGRWMLVNCPILPAVSRPSLGNALRCPPYT